jgi:hypothetical protein
MFHNLVFLKIALCLSFITNDQIICCVLVLMTAQSVIDLCRMNNCVDYRFRGPWRLCDVHVYIISCLGC